MSRTTEKPKQTIWNLKFLFCLSEALADVLLFAFHGKVGGPYPIKLCTKLADMPRPTSLKYVHGFKMAAGRITSLAQSLRSVFFNNSIFITRYNNYKFPLNQTLFYFLANVVKLFILVYEVVLIFSVGKHEYSASII